MSAVLENIWKFETEHFLISVDACVETNYDDLEEWADDINSGELVVFMARALVVHKATGYDVASSYLGQCIHKNYTDFRDHLGLAAHNRVDDRNYGSYFSQMVREVCEEARTSVKVMQTELGAIKLRNVA